MSPTQSTKSSSTGDNGLVAVVGILASVGLCVAGLVSGLATLGAIVAICAKTDASKLLSLWRK